MTKTEKYQLPQWELSDRILMEDFNEMAAKIDKGMDGIRTEAAAGRTQLTEGLAALNADVHPGAPGQIARVATGTYVGEGACGPDHPNSLTFDFKPVLVFVRSADEFNYHILMRPSQKSASNGGASVQVTWGERSVTWNYSSKESAFIVYQCNSKDVTYTYTVIGAAE